MFYRSTLFTLVFISALFSLWATDEKINSLIKAFEEYAEEQRILWKIPGMAIAIVKDERVIFEKGFGQRGIKNTEPVDQDTLFQIGSLSKAFTSTLLAIANDRGLLKWEDKVIDHFPSFRLYDSWVSAEFQINDLCSHRSGLYPFAGDYQVLFGLSPEEIVHHLAYLYPATSFRSRYAYQNTLFLVASKILESKLLLPFPALLSREIFEPLEMKNSSVSLEEFLAFPNRAEWHRGLKDGNIEALPEEFPFNNFTYVLGPAAGINSTIKDLSHWMILQINQGKFKNREIISKKNMQFLKRPNIYVGEIDGQDIYYAQGWFHIDNSPYPIIWHDGRTLGACSMAGFIPQEKLGIVILTNVGNASLLPLALALQFFDHYFDKPDRNWGSRFLELTKNQILTQTEALPQETFPPMPLRLYTGTYTNPIYGELIVKEENQTLLLSLGKISHSFSLKHWDRDIFTLEFPFNISPPSRVSFGLDPKGEVFAIRLYCLFYEGAGDFKKQ
ncbi:serine hydrolase [Parachlamydia sp. AcF125]|uniref:serine hydrolase n=1 Tax=Parachlamydia sp. AcF125 TaxID=2795736 RepID=UPI001BC932CD|nr:serine hydrolase [Parachlamydia sp. AcF125]MBS4169258.1 Beta-lactamase [Parachlamydia sp. AcF125]